MTEIPPTPSPESTESLAADQEPRHCPSCGNRVANQATSCLMCGSSLLQGEPEPVETQEPQKRRINIPWMSLFVGLFTIVAFLGLIAFWINEQMTRVVFTPTPTLTVTATRKPTNTSTPTPSPTITLTPTPIPPIAHQVQEGETLLGIAEKYPGVTVEQIREVNDNLKDSDLIVAGDIVLVPGATPTPGPTPTPDPSQPTPTMACPRIHVVKSGETLDSIAQDYNVSMDIVQRANGIDDPDSLQVNHSLQIPCPTPVPTLSPTPDLNASPTPRPKYAAPALLNPPDQALLCEAVIPLQWSAVSLLEKDEWYIIRLRRIDVDHELVSLPSKTTLWRLDQTFGPPPETGVYEFSWEVIVVRQSGVRSSGEPHYMAASYPSQRRTFNWSFPTPTPGPSPTP